MMLLVDEPGTRRMFVNDMRGPLYSVSYDGKSVGLYLDINAPAWGVSVQSQGNERGFQSFAFHPQFSQAGTRGFGKFYTYTDTSNTTPAPDFRPGGGTRTHDTVLLEWTAKTPAAEAYDGGPPRELIRFEQPFANHNAGQTRLQSACVTRQRRFRSAVHGLRRRRQRRRPARQLRRISARPSARSCASTRLAPTAPTASTAFPPGNPFVSDGNAATLGEIYASGVRNPQRFSWDPKNGNMFVADIGQNIVEEISIVTAGANLGWNDWEGSFTYISRDEVGLANQRGDAKVTYPLVEYGQLDPLLQSQSAVTGVIVYRQTAIPQLANLRGVRRQPQRRDVLFQRRQSPQGRAGRHPPDSVQRQRRGEDAARADQGSERQAGKDARHARRPALRSRAGRPDSSSLNKRDGIIRLLVPG